ncbi:hypothetical protein V2W45_1183608, partial [Cenococcum geophilum]
ILKQLIDTINPESPPKPYNYFDIIKGTSTSGLIAIILGWLYIMVNKCINIYLAV